MTDSNKPEVVAYPVNKNEPRGAIVPSPRIRSWQKQTADAFATRCLPLNIANNCGWEIQLPGGFDVLYSGGTGKNAIAIYPHGDGPVSAISHFGHGTLTFHLGYFFSTPADVNLMVTGPLNEFKDGLVAMAGLVETDWSPYGTTMNWKFTRPCRVRFSKGEAFAQLIPMPAAYVNAFSARIGDMEREQPERLTQLENWVHTRNEFNRGLAERDEETVKQKWQKLYYRGLYPDGQTRHEKHKTRLAPQPFEGLEQLLREQSGDGVGSHLPATCEDLVAVVRIDSTLDWRVTRTVDEASRRAKQVFVVFPAKRFAEVDLLEMIPYQHVELLPVGQDDDMISMIKAKARFDHFVLMNTHQILLSGFWARLPEYVGLLDKSYDEVALEFYECNKRYPSLEAFEQAEKMGQAISQPTGQLATVLCKREVLGQSGLSVFRGKDRLVET
ncbi:MAG: DUF6065 family protein [Limnobacter sp.]|nr:DUF6065 family protein [Limnobacter sp.]